MPNILTGLKPNASLHLGNYLGAIVPLVKQSLTLSPKDKLFMFVPNLHAITVATEYQKIPKSILESIKMYIAAGLQVEDPKVYVYRQSYIPAHCELTWILSCFTYYGEAQRMTQFKDKTNQKDQVTVGLFTYPILMAADILLYQAEFVPLGEDQRQHLELTRNIAIRINNRFKTDLLVVPKPWKEQLDFMGIQEGVRIRSLSNPHKKMSKSVSDPKGTIALTDKPKDAVKKIMLATTDSLGEINWDWNKQPGVTNLLQILCLFQEKSLNQICGEWQGNTRYGDLKKTVAKVVEDFLEVFQAKVENISEDKAISVLKKGEDRATGIANSTLKKVQQATGMN